MILMEYDTLYFACRVCAMTALICSSMDAVSLFEYLDMGLQFEPAPGRCDKVIAGARL